MTVKERLLQLYRQARDNDDGRRVPREYVRPARVSPRCAHGFCGNCPDDGYCQHDCHREAAS